MRSRTENLPKVERLADASNELGFRLMSLLLQEPSGQNTLLSSFSVTLALAMTYNGAEGRSKEALADALGVKELSLPEANRAMAALMSMGEALDADVTLAIANAIWVQQGVEPGAEFVQRISDTYDGEFASVSFRDPATADTINEWVAKKTDERIDQLVTPNLIEEAIMVLINAIAFKGLWASPFDEAMTEKRPFTLLSGDVKQHPMMRQTGRFRYLENDDLQAVSLPYGSGRISMVICLPKPGVSVSELQRGLADGELLRPASEFVEMEGEITLPRFKVQYGVDLLPYLQRVVGDAISETDFRGMGAGPLYISNVIHKTFLEVNEEGTEAAAATAVVMLRGMVHRFKMTVDRPFFCAIRDEVTGLLLFLGWVLDPSSA